MRLSLILCFPAPSFSIIVNATSGVKRFQFAKVFWDYTESTEGAQGDAAEKSAASLRKLPFTSVWADHTAQAASPSPKIRDCNNKKPERAELLRPACFLPTPTKCQAPGEHAPACVKK